MQAQPGQKENVENGDEGVVGAMTECQEDCVGFPGETATSEPMVASYNCDHMHVGLNRGASQTLEEEKKLLPSFWSKVYNLLAVAETRSSHEGR